MARIGLVGFGGIGIEAAKALVTDTSLTAELIAFDRKEAVEAVPSAQAGAYEEILDAIGILGTGASIKLTSSLEDLEGCDAIIFTAGIPRQANQNRADLIGVNIPIVGALTKHIGKVAPNAFFVMVTNPLDAMVELAYRNLGLPASHVVGQAGVLDTGRFTIQAALATGRPASQVDTLVLGGHGPTMVPVYSAAKVAYKPLDQWLNAAELTRITDEVKDRGRTIIKRQGRSATFSTAIASVKMVKAYLSDTQAILPACTRLNGEYGYSGLFAGVATRIGRNGASPVEVPLTETERAAFDASVRAVKEEVAELNAAG